MKKTIFTLIGIFGFGTVAFALPYFQQTQGLIPDVTDKHYVGTSTPSLLEYNGIFTKNLTISGICTGCGAGGASAYEIATTSTISVPQLSYFTKTSGRTTLGGVATTTVSCSGSASCTPFVAIGASPITISATGGSGSGTVSTSTNELQGRLSYWTSNSATPALLGQVATSSLGVSTGLTSSGTLGSQVGGSASTISFASINANSLWANMTGSAGVPTNIATSSLFQNSSATITGLLSSTDWSTFNGKESVLTFTTPIMRSANTISWVGLATTTQPSTSNLLTSNGGAGVYGTATSTLTASAPLTGSFTQVGSGGSLGCTNASSGVTGCLTGANWDTFNNKQATISATWPITLSGATLSFGWATTSQPATSNVFVSNGSNGFYGVATSSETCTSPLSCTAFNVVGSGGGAITLGTVTTAKGGTNQTSWTAGSIPYLSSATQFAEDNANLFWNGTLHYMGIGTTTPVWPLTVASTTGPQLALSAGAGLPQWVFANESGNLYISTTTTAGTATTTTAAFTITSTGKPGLAISSSTPTATLTLQTNTTDFTNQLYIGSSTPAFKIDNSSHIFAPLLTQSGSTQTYYLCGAANTFEMVWDTTTCLVSALKFKKDISPLTTQYGLAAVLAMKPVTYYKKEPLNFTDAGQQIGFIADWSANIVPQLIGKDKNGDIRSFNYEQYTAVLTQAIQELNKKIDMERQPLEKTWEWFVLSLLIIWNIGLTYLLRKKYD